MRRDNLNMVNGGSSNWRQLVVPKKIHFNWKTNVSEINNWVFWGSSREIAVLGISSPICGSHPGHQTLSFAQFLKFQSTQRKKGLRTLPWSTLKTLIQIISQKEEHEVKFSKTCWDLPSIFLMFQCCDHQVKSTLFIPDFTIFIPLASYWYKLRPTCPWIKAWTYSK